MRKKINFSIIFLMMTGFIYAQTNAYEMASEYQNSQETVELDPNFNSNQNRSADLIYDNGPLVNSSSTGVGGADESVLQNIGLGLNILGLGHQLALGFWIADDFIINSSGGWDITSLDFYAYQTGSTTTSTITDLRILIFDGDPSLPTSSLIWGDETTNRLSNTEWSGMYRVQESTSGAAVNRPIMKNTANLNLHLEPGTYWLVWQTGGTLGSGPWAPPITINGLSTTGNGKQSLDGLSTYFEVLDSGTNTAQGFPFQVYGTAIEHVPLSNWTIIFSLLIIGLFSVFRFKF